MTKRMTHPHEREDMLAGHSIAFNPSVEMNINNAKTDVSSLGWHMNVICNVFITQLAHTSEVLACGVLDSCSLC